MTRGGLLAARPELFGGPSAPGSATAAHLVVVVAVLGELDDLDVRAGEGRQRFPGRVVPEQERRTVRGEGLAVGDAARGELDAARFPVEALVEEQLVQVADLGAEFRVVSYPGGEAGGFKVGGGVEGHFPVEG